MNAREYGSRHQSSSSSSHVWALFFNFTCLVAPRSVGHINQGNGLVWSHAECQLERTNEKIILHLWTSNTSRDGGRGMLQMASSPACYHNSEKWDAMYLFLCFLCPLTNLYLRSQLTNPALCCPLNGLEYSQGETRRPGETYSVYELPINCRLTHGWGESDMA